MQSVMELLLSRAKAELKSCVRLAVVGTCYIAPSLLEFPVCQGSFFNWLPIQPVPSVYFWQRHHDSLQRGLGFIGLEAYDLQTSYVNSGCVGFKLRAAERLPMNRMLKETV